MRFKHTCSSANRGDFIFWGKLGSWAILVKRLEAERFFGAIRDGDERLLPKSGST
jgi:hypothetical protein